MMRRVAAAWRARQRRRPPRLERHLRGDDELIQGLRMAAAAANPAMTEAMERRTRPGERQGPPDERQP